MFKTIFPLSLILSLRFFGLFIVMPIISLYAVSLEGSAPMLVGIAIGGFALSQVILQVPFGLLSDKIGRKKTIAMGLLIFIAGSLVCMVSSDIYTLIFGRILQGAGAIGAVMTAMISDLVDDEVRPKAMAIMGASISMSFALAVILGPVLYSFIGGDGLFGLVAALMVGAIAVLFLFAPDPPKRFHPFEEEEARWFSVLKDPNLRRMNLTNFLQKGIMTSTFMLIPLMLTQDFSWNQDDLYLLYLPATFAGMLSLMPAVILAQKKGQYKTVLILGIALFGTAYLMMGAGEEQLFLLGAALFFVGFNMHEPIMQSLASRYAKINQRGAALGVFNSFGFLGTFLGVVFSSYLYGHFGIELLSGIIVVICALWSIVIAVMPNPSRLQNLYLKQNEYDSAHPPRLNELDGVIEWHLETESARLGIKYDNTLISKEEILAAVK